MATEDNYFHIDLSMLKDEIIFPFNLHIFNPGNGGYNLILHANSPLTEEKLSFFKFIVKRNGEIAISMSQSRTFLKSLDYKKDDIPSLKEPEKHHLETERYEKIKKQEIEEAKELLKNGGKKSIFKLTSELSHALDNDDFTHIINEARKEISIFSVRESVTTSLSAYLSETLLTEDNFINRVVSISYFFAKNCDITSEYALGNLVCAAFFHHLGHTQIDHALVSTPHLELSDKGYKQYKKHAGLSSHLIKKSQIDISTACLNTIESHHERFDGSGYPQSKIGDHIDINSLIIGSISHIFEYSSGHITGTKKAFKSVISNLRNKNFTPGLEFEFGDKVYNNLVTLINENADNSDTQSDIAA